MYLITEKTLDKVTAQLLIIEIVCEQQKHFRRTDVDVTILNPPPSHKSIAFTWHKPQLTAEQGVPQLGGGDNTKPWI
jgi:hypothetical protein